MSDDTRQGTRKQVICEPTILLIVVVGENSTVVAVDATDLYKAFQKAGGVGTRCLESVSKCLYHC